MPFGKPTRILLCVGRTTCGPKEFTSLAPDRALSAASAGGSPAPPAQGLGPNPRPRLAIVGQGGQRALGEKILAGLVAKPLKRLKTGKEREGKSPSQDHSRTRFGPKREGFGRLKGRSCGPKPRASPSPRALMPVRTDVRLVPSHRIRRMRIAKGAGERPSHREPTH